MSRVEYLVVIAFLVSLGGAAYSSEPTELFKCYEKIKQVSNAERAPKIKGHSIPYDIKYDYGVEVRDMRMLADPKHVGTWYIFGPFMTKKIQFKPSDRGVFIVNVEPGRRLVVDRDFKQSNQAEASSKGYEFEELTNFPGGELTLRDKIRSLKRLPPMVNAINANVADANQILASETKRQIAEVFSHLQNPNFDIEEVSIQAPDLWREGHIETLQMCMKVPEVQREATKELERFEVGGASPSNQPARLSPAVR